MRKFMVGITGASGSIFADRLIEVLLMQGHEVFLVVTSNGEKVSIFELETPFETLMEKYRKLAESYRGRITVCPNNDMFSSIASGSVKVDAMIIVPCSMGTLGKIAHGISDSLLIRAADVAVKEHRKLVLVTRETPLSSIHLENMLKLSRLGVIMMPPVPAFYSKPTTLDESINLSVGRILDTINVENSYHKRWGESDENE